MTFDKLFFPFGGTVGGVNVEAGCLVAQCENVGFVVRAPTQVTGISDGCPCNTFERNLWK